MEILSFLSKIKNSQEFKGWPEQFNEEKKAFKKLSTKKMSFRTLLPVARTFLREDINIQL